MVDTQVRVVNKYGKDVAKNGKEPGDIIVKGEGVTTDYLDHPSHNGWVYTGDIGTIDAEGKVQVVKSKQDIDTDHNQVSTFDIEMLLNEHPAILEACVIPQPDPKLGEIAHAFLVVNEPPIEEQKLMMDIQNKQPAITQQIKFTFMDELPKTPSGKILKQRLTDI